MKYILITKMGKVMVFGVKDCAELYQTINGGVIVCTDEELKEETYYAQTSNNSGN